jgi:nucleoside triphosphate diphosphatase
LSKPRYDFDEVVTIIRRLRSPGGCPWDNEQTLQTLRKYLLEEVYEALDAIDNEQYDGICEELGDVLWETLFVARIAEQDGHFTIDDVVQGLGEKMVRRHPHIFGEEKLTDSDQVLKQWAQIKLEEGKTTRMGKILEGIPDSLPALLRAHRVSERVAKIGFDWENSGQVMEKFDEELTEFREAVDTGDSDRIEDELGDLLFTLINVARHMDLSAEDALRRTTGKFTTRFSQIERVLADRGETFEGKPIEELESLWQAAKKKVG